MNEATVADWQHRLDSEYPRGVVASWDDSDKHSATYLLPRIYVTDMTAAGYPVIWASAHSGSDKVLGPWEVTSYTVAQLRPRAARVTFENVERAMTWSAGMDDKLVASMAAERADGIRRYPDGGKEVLHQ